MELFLSSAGEEERRSVLIELEHLRSGLGEGLGDETLRNCGSARGDRMLGDEGGIRGDGGCP